MQVAREQHHLNDDGRDARAGESARSRPSRTRPEKSRATSRRPAPLEKREKSIVMTSNIASASTTNNTKMPRLNQGDALIVPNVPAVRITIKPRTP
jgi:hypothetical protein